MLSSGVPDVLAIDEFSMLDFSCCAQWKYSLPQVCKKPLLKPPMGGRHVLLLGDPTQLPAVSRMDIFGTTLWRQFSVLLLREVKRAEDPVLASI